MEKWLGMGMGMTETDRKWQTIDGKWQTMTENDRQWQEMTGKSEHQPWCFSLFQPEDQDWWQTMMTDNDDNDDRQWQLLKILRVC